MKKIFLFHIFLLCGFCLFAQTKIDPVVHNDSTLQKSLKGDQLPEYPGGADSLYRFIYNHLGYPIAAKDSCIQGKVYVKFRISETGKVSDVICDVDIGGGCGAEAAR